MKFSNYEEISIGAAEEGGHRASPEEEGHSEKREKEG